MLRQGSIAPLDRARGFLEEIYPTIPMVCGFFASGQISVPSKDVMQIIQDARNPRSQRRMEQVVQL
jgi:hypothetical protein